MPSRVMTTVSIFVLLHAHVPLKADDRMMTDASTTSMSDDTFSVSLIRSRNATAQHENLHHIIPAEPEKSACSEFAAYPFVMLNLDRRVDRLHMMESTLPTWLCKKTCRVPAVDKNSLTARPYYIPEKEWAGALDIEKRKAAKGKKRTGWQLTPGAIALLETTRQVWKQIVSTNTTTIVMEDDVMVPRPNELRAAICALQKRSDWSLVQFQADTMRRFKSPFPTLTRGIVWNTGMYVVTPDAAQKLLVTLDGGTARQLDDPHGVLRSTFPTTGFHYEPPLAVQTAAGKNTTDVQVVTNKYGELASDTCKIKDCPGSRASPTSAASAASPATGPRPARAVVK